MSRTPRPDDDFRRIIEGNDWTDIPEDFEDQEPWADEIPWQPRAQPEAEIPAELRETDENASYSPDPGALTKGVSGPMLRALSVVVGVLVSVAGLALLPGRLPPLVWAAAVAALVGGLYLVFRALPEDPRDDDGAVV